MAATISATEQLDQQKQRVDRLNARRTRVQVQLESAREQYATAVKEAEQLYGTSDLDKLRATLIKQEADNAQAVADFIRAVDEFDKYLTKIEEALSNPEAMAELVATMAPASEPAPAVQPTATPAPAFDAQDI